MKCKIFSLILIFHYLSLISNSWAVDALTLELALKSALNSNLEIAVSIEKSKAEESLTQSQFWLDNPRFGLMHEKNMNLMEQAMGPMNTWSITQEIKFPTKYFLMGSAQRAKAQSSKFEALAKKLEIRRKLVNSYYNLFSINKIIDLLQAQKETLVELARSAESRHASGSVPQQDEMKAHVEQTKLEIEILNLSEEKNAAEAQLNALLNHDPHQEVTLVEKKLFIPQLTTSSDEILKLALAHSKQIQANSALVQEADKRKALAGWNFMPDFAVTYKKAWSSAPVDNYAFGVEISIPLWFLVKQSSEYSFASSRAIEAEKTLEKIKLDVNQDIRSLSSKVIAYRKLLKIYETGLIPQAASTLSSSRIAYQAGRINFLEFLDSERSLYSVQVAFLRALVQYIEYLTQLEETAGISLSTLPFGEII